MPVFLEFVYVHIISPPSSHINIFLPNTIILKYFIIIKHILLFCYSVICYDVFTFFQLFSYLKHMQLF